MFKFFKDHWIESLVVFVIMLPVLIGLPLALMKGQEQLVMRCEHYGKEPGETIMLGHGGHTKFVECP